MSFQDDEFKEDFNEEEVADIGADDFEDVDDLDLDTDFSDDEVEDFGMDDEEDKDGQY